MDRLRLFAAIMKLVWWIAGLFTDAAKKNKAEPVETEMDPADNASVVKVGSANNPSVVPIGRRTAKRGVSPKRKYDPVTKTWS